MDEFFDYINDIKVTEEVEEEKASKINIFNYLNDICYSKTGNLFKERDPNLKGFDTFMILRYLSLEEGYLPFINVLNKYQDTLTKEEMYKALILIVPRAKKFLEYPKLKKKSYDEKTLRYIKDYFQCSMKEVFELVDLSLLSIKDINKIIEKYGGKVK